MAIKKNAPNYLKVSQQPFTTLINKTIDLIPDPAAIGIYVYLASKQTDWIIQEKDLMNRFNVGRDFIRARMKILKDLGLLIKEAVRDEKGRILHWDTTLLNEINVKASSKQNIHITEKPPSGKPRHLDNPTHIKKGSNERNNSNINISTSCESPNVSYTSSDEQKDENGKSGYYNNLSTPQDAVGQPHDSKINNVKSDYFEYQPNNCTDSKSTKRFDLKNILNENTFQIPEEIILDWIENRKKKRAAITKTAWNKINKELAKCQEKGINPLDAFETMVAAGWQSLKAEYFENDKKTSSSQWDVDSVMRA